MNWVNPYIPPQSDPGVDVGGSKLLNFGRHAIVGLTALIGVLTSSGALIFAFSLFENWSVLPQKGDKALLTTWMFMLGLSLCVASHAFWKNKFRFGVFWLGVTLTLVVLGEVLL